MQIVRKRPLPVSGAGDHQEYTKTLPVDDSHLVEQAQRDPQVFAVLYQRYRQSIYVYCFRRLGNPDAADDATSIIFMKAFTALGRFRTDRSQSGSTFRSWLFSIAHNVVVDDRRRDRHHASLDANDGAMLQSPRFIDPASTPEDAAIGAEEARKVRVLLAQLPERQRAAVELRLAGLSTNEVAHALGMSVPAAKSIQFRAYRALRDLLHSDPTAITREIPT
jgi:RNA polymerase sigma-70 factor (ECF subfamily)